MTNLKNYVNHSGGAKGADSAWDYIGRKYGVTDHNHYWHKGSPRPPLGNLEITDEDLEEGWAKVLLANKTLKRRPDSYRSLLSRNWFQVKNAEAIFAVSTIAMNKSIPNEVSGGTGWAVQMAIDAGKEVYVFDQDLGHWLRWSSTHFTPCPTPTLTENFAGIGTRNLNDNGIKAIEEIYSKIL